MPDNRHSCGYAPYPGICACPGDDEHCDCDLPGSTNCQPAITETIRFFDAGEWRDIVVPVPDQPARRTHGRRTHKPGQTARHGDPVTRAGLASGSPFAYGMADTAFAPGEPLADMRRHIPEPTMITHRAPVVAFGGNPGDPDGRARWVDL
jgi:hypothetical protein